MSEQKEKQSLSKKPELNKVTLSVTPVPETKGKTLPDSRQWISDSAYFKALMRGFIPEHEVQDWLEAEKEYETLMSRHWKSGLVRLR
jgi:hypothetical protein